MQKYCNCIWEEATWAIENPSDTSWIQAVICWSLNHIEPVGRVYFRNQSYAKHYADFPFLSVTGFPIKHDYPDMKSRTDHRFKRKQTSAPELPANIPIPKIRFLCTETSDLRASSSTGNSLPLGHWAMSSLYQKW